MAPHHRGSSRVLHTVRVAPSSNAGASTMPERTVPLTFLDVIWLRSPPVERVFFYRLSDNDGDVDAVLSRLVESLSQVLHDFYPLAGRLRRTPGTANRYELFYQVGDGVAFTVAEHDCVGVDELTADEPRDVTKILPLHEDGAVLAVQATVLLPARRGIALGVTVHHAACDGSSSTHFLHTWAAVCAGAAVPSTPVINRTCIREREDIYDMMTTTEMKDHYQKKFRSPDAVDDKLLATFTLSKENLQSIKDAVAGDAACRSAPPLRCTSIVATFSVTWHCHIRSAELVNEADSEEPQNDGVARFNFLTNHRARMEPRVPDKYLGNCVGPCFASASNKKISATGMDGLFTTCSVIAAAIDEGTRYNADYWDRCVEHGKELRGTDAGPPVSVAGSPRFSVYDVDFGFGRPVNVEIVSVAKTGAISVAELARGGSVASPPPPHGGGFRVVRTDRVAPSPPACCPVLPERTVPLTFLDSIWLRSSPFNRVFFYRLAGCTERIDAVLSRLADSLSRALHVFYPLAGRLRLTQGKINRYELSLATPSPSMTASALTSWHRTNRGRFQRLPRSCRTFRTVSWCWPCRPPTRRLRRRRLDALPPHLGHHLRRPPIIDRTFVRECDGVYNYMTTRLKEHNARSPDFVADKLLTTFTLTRENLQLIKDRVFLAAARCGVAPPRCTSIVATYAMMWQCAFKLLNIGQVARPGDGGRALGPCAQLPK
uniref:Uncharacterized protein n=1 Tax=Leersia perrieri TaxID=77586 RepID=A0A0D9VG14_9ORYZ